MLTKSYILWINTKQNVKENLNNCIRKCINSLKGEEGITTAEWAILTVVLAVICVGAGAFLAPIFRGMVTRLGTQLNTANNQQF